MTWRVRNPTPQFGAPDQRPIIPVCEPWLSGNELKYVTEAEAGIKP